MILFIIGVLVGWAASLAFILLPILPQANILILELGKFMYIADMDIDDDEKQDKLNSHFLVLSKSLFLFAIALIAFLAISIGFAWLLHYLATITDNMDKGLLNALASLEFLGGTFLGVIPAVFTLKLINNRKEAAPTETYTPFAKFLHYVFLGNRPIARLLFFIWQKRGKGVQPGTNKPIAVYVSGLARAGTTVLMQSLGKDERFKSLSYNDLPLLFLPSDSNKNTTEIKAVERAHSDGVMHSLESYEALEEPFWRTFQPDYIQKDHLQPQTITEKTYNKYLFFRSWYAKDSIYLCKNNNHLLRAESLLKLDKQNNLTSKTIIPFRHPVAHAHSLMKQHMHLSQMQQDDQFVLDYMDMLVHNEFGLGRKQTIYAIEDLITGGDWSKLETWIEYWHSYYQGVVKQYENNEDIAFISYESFCANPQATLESIYQFLNLTAVVHPDLEPFVPTPTEDVLLDVKVEALYHKMSNLALN